jgi:hypothetical protein
MKEAKRPREITTLKVKYQITADYEAGRRGI